MKTIYAADVLHYFLEEILELGREDDEPFILTFDDEQIETRWSELLIPWVLWKFHREWPETPLYSNTHLQGEIFSPELQLKLLQRCKEAVKEAYPDEDDEELNRVAYEVTNDWHNVAVGDLEEYVGTMDALDTLQIYQHEGIQEARRTIFEEPTSRTINKIYSKIKYYLINDPVFRSNNYSIALRQGTAKVGQLLQIVGLRGRCSEINQKIFKNPITVGFMDGLTRASFFAMESRSATTAMMSTDDPVKTTEYYNRELQLLNYGVKSINPVDCGTDETYPWTVTAEDLDRVLPGKYYIDKDGKTKAVRKKDRWLIGKTINLRTPAYCWEKKDACICKYCLGEVSDSFQRNANVQYQATVTQNEGVSQNTISVKHLLMSAESDCYIIDPFYAPYFDNIANDKEISLTTGLWLKNDIKIAIDMRDIPRLSDVVALPTLEGRDIAQFSRLTTIELSYTEHGKQDPTVLSIPMSRGSYKPYLTKEFLNYIRDYSYDVEAGKVIISLNNWPESEVLFRLPERRGSTLEAAIQLKKVIFNVGDDTSNTKLRLRMDLRDPLNMAKVMRDITDLTNYRFNVSLPIIELVMYATMARNPDVGDYRLPKKGDTIRLCTQKALMNGRSLSLKAAHERHYEMVTRPESYLITDRPDAPFDEILVPE